MNFAERFKLEQEEIEALLKGVIKHQEQKELDAQDDETVESDAE